MRPLVILLFLLETAQAHRTSRPPAAQATTADRAAIRRVLKTRMPTIVDCFQRDGLTSTRVVVDFAIDATGKVTSTHTTGTASWALQRCVANVFAKLTFPRWVGGAVRVLYPVQICAAGQ